MKSIYIKLGICALAIVALFSCKKQNELTLSPNTSTLELYVGETFQMKVNSYGSKDTTAYNMTGITWSIADEFVGVISADGIVTAKHQGITSISGKLSDGRVVFTDLVVLSSNEMIEEPSMDVAEKDLVTAEAVAGRKLLRSGDGYYVFKDVTDNPEVLPYVIYFTNGRMMSVACVGKETSLDDVTKYLLDRYNQTADGVFADNNNHTVTMYKNPDAYGPSLIYNQQGDASTIFSIYMTDATKDLNIAADPATYDAKKLGLVLPFVLTVDAAEVQTLVNTASAVLGSTSSFTEAETAEDFAVSGIKDLYLEAARRWATEEWCWKLHKDPISGGLRKGHVKEEYSDLSWLRVIELDEMLADALDTVDVFADIDAIAQRYGSLYADIAAKSNQNTAVKNVNNYYNTANKNLKKYYSDDCWATVTALKDQAVTEITDNLWSMTSINNLVTTTNVAKDIDSFSGPKSYYQDVPTIAIKEDVIADLDYNFSQYNESDYLQANWIKMENMYNESRASIAGSCSREQITSLSSEAKLYFNNMPKK